MCFIKVLGRITLVFIYFGFYVLPFLYLASYFFAIPSTGFSRTMLIGAVAGSYNFFLYNFLKFFNLGIVGLAAIQVLELKVLELTHIATPLNWVLLFIPFYSVAKGAYDLGSIYNLRQICT